MRLTEDNKQQIIQLYKEGKSCRQIETVTKIDRKVVSSILKTEGIFIRKYNDSFTKNITIEQIDFIISTYINGHFSCEKIGAAYNICPATIGKILKDNNIKIREYKNKLYTVNENFFDYINTEDSAYILGLLFADGCNNPKTGAITLSLQSNDVDILEKINIRLDSNRPLKIRVEKRFPDRKNMAILSVNNKYMSEKLSELGCVKSKSLILQFPSVNLLPKYLHRHFIRGYFDGDGCFYIGKNKKNYTIYSFHITSTKEFCEECSKIILENTGVTGNVYTKWKKNTNTREYKFGGTKVFKVLDWLYDDATIYLDRKYNKYKQAKQLISGLVQ